MDRLTYIFWTMTMTKPLGEIYKTRYFCLHLIRSPSLVEILAKLGNGHGEGSWEGMQRRLRERDCVAMTCGV